jgi:hypothetical protein
MLGRRRFSTRLAALGLCLVLPLTAVAAKKPPDVSHDGLVRVPKTKLALVYVKPGADFSAYERIALLDAEVAFKKGWQREQNQTDPLRISKRDMDEIRTALAELFREVFTEVLGEGGFAFSDVAAPDVLIVRPGIIDLYIEAPDTVATSSRTHTFSTSAGAMTLVLEAYDSSTREILARVADRQAARDTGFMIWQNAATNRAEARRILTGWAETLRDGLQYLRSHPVEAPR